MSKDQELYALNQTYQEELRSFLADFQPEFPPEFVFGDGRSSCRLMLVGEAPGRDEVRQGRPFVGKAGAILQDFLERIGLDRQDLYITNTMKYRLAKAGSRPGSIVNRPASAEEIRRSAPFLRQEIEILRPECVVSLGNVPLSCIQQCFAPSQATWKIGSCHGRTMPVTINQGATAFFPCYHPASMIYNPGLRAIYEADLRKLRELFL